MNPASLAAGVELAQNEPVTGACCSNVRWGRLSNKSKVPVDSPMYGLDGPAAWRCAAQGYYGAQEAKDEYSAALKDASARLKSLRRALKAFKGNNCAARDSLEDQYASAALEVADLRGNLARSTEEHANAYQRVALVAPSANKALESSVGCARTYLGELVRAVEVRRCDSDRKEKALQELEENLSQSQERLCKASKRVSGQD